MRHNSDQWGESSGSFLTSKRCFLFGLGCNCVWMWHLSPPQPDNNKDHTKHGRVRKWKEPRLHAIIAWLTSAYSGLPVTGENLLVKALWERFSVSCSSKYSVLNTLLLAFSPDPLIFSSWITTSVSTFLSVPPFFSFSLPSPLFPNCSCPSSTIQGEPLAQSDQITPTPFSHFLNHKMLPHLRPHSYFTADRPGWIHARPAPESVSLHVGVP